MDQEAILEAAPLLQGELLDRREDIKTNLVKYGLSIDRCPEEFTIERLRVIIDSEININLDTTSISNGLKELSDDGFIEYIYLIGGTRLLRSLKYHLLILLSLQFGRSLRRGLKNLGPNTTHT